MSDASRSTSTPFMGRALLRVLVCGSALPCCGLGCSRQSQTTDSPKPNNVQAASSSTAAGPQLEPFEAADSEGHLISRGFRTRRADGNYLREGEWTYYFPDGTIREQGEYSNDRKSGRWSYYRINTGHSPHLDPGQRYLSHEERYENGEVVYKWIYSYRPRIVSAEGPMRRGMKHGTWITYEPTGEKRAEANYQSDRIIEPIRQAQ